MKRAGLVAVIIVAIFGASLYYYQAYPQKKELKTINIGYQADEYMYETLVNIATEKGYFAREGVKIEKLPSVNNISSALDSGEIDVTISANTTYLLGFLNNQDYVFINTLGTRPAFTGVVAKQGNISSLKKAAVAKLAGAGQMFTDVVVPNLGLSGEIEYVVAAIGAPQIAAIERGDADFTVTNIFTADLEKILAGKDLQLVYPTELWGDKKLPTGIMTTKKSIERNKDQIRGFVRAINKAQEYSKNNTSYVSEMLVKQYGVSKTLADSSVSAYLQTIPKTHLASEADLTDILPVIKAMKVKAASRPISEYIDNQFVR